MANNSSIKNIDYNIIKAREIVGVLVNQVETSIRQKNEVMTRRMKSLTERNKETR